MPRFKVRDSDDKGEPVPFTADDLAQSVFPDMVVEVQSLDTFSGFAKGTCKAHKQQKSQPSDQNPVAPLPGSLKYTYSCLLNGVQCQCLN